MSSNGDNLTGTHLDERVAALDSADHARAARMARELAAAYGEQLSRMETLELSNLLARAYKIGLAEGDNRGVPVNTLRHLATDWRTRAWADVPAAYRDRGLSAKYLHADNIQAGMTDCAEELDDMLNKMF